MSNSVGLAVAPMVVLWLIMPEAIDSTRAQTLTWGAVGKVGVAGPAGARTCKP